MGARAVRQPALLGALRSKRGGLFVRLKRLDRARARGRRGASDGSPPAAACSARGHRATHPRQTPPKHEARNFGARRDTRDPEFERRAPDPAAGLPARRAGRALRHPHPKPCRAPRAHTPETSRPLPFPPGLPHARARASLPPFFAEPIFSASGGRARTGAQLARQPALSRAPLHPTRERARAHAASARARSRPRARRARARAARTRTLPRAAVARARARAPARAQRPAAAVNNIAGENENAPPTVKTPAWSGATRCHLTSLEPKPPNPILYMFELFRRILRKGSGLAPPRAFAVMAAAHAARAARGRFAERSLRFRGGTAREVGVMGR